MSTVQLDLADDVVAVLRDSDLPVETATQELVVLELYRRRAISGDRAAELLGVDRPAFVRRASELAIPLVDLTDAERREALEQVRRVREHNRGLDEAQAMALVDRFMRETIGEMTAEGRIRFDRED